MAQIAAARKNNNFFMRYQAIIKPKIELHVIVPFEQCQDVHYSRYTLYDTSTRGDATYKDHTQSSTSELSGLGAILCAHKTLVRTRVGTHSY